jgi:hypothetical protein
LSSPRRAALTRSLKGIALLNLIAGALVSLY